MKYCSDKKKIGCLLAGLAALLVTGYASAADKKLSPTQQLRSTSPGSTVHVPVKIPPPFIQLNSVKQTTTKPVKKPVRIKPVSSFAVKKKQPGNRGLSPIKPSPARRPVKSSRQPVKPATVAPRAVNPGSGFSYKTRSPIQVPVLLTPPVRQAQPVAPVLLNPRNGGFAPVGRAGQRTNPPTKRLNNVTGRRVSPAHRGGFAPNQVYGGATTSSGRAPGRAPASRGRPSANTFQNPLPGDYMSTSVPVLTGPSSVQNQGGKDDPDFGEFINELGNEWAEDDMAIGGGKVPDPDDASIAGSPSSGESIGNGDVTRMQSDGSKATSHLDGRTDTFDTEGGHLETSSGMKTSPGASGGTDVEDRRTGVRGHFGADNVHNDAGEIKDSGSGYSELPDGGRITDESNGSISVGNVDGSTDTWQRDGSHLHTGPGIKTVATPDGGTDVIGPDGKYTAHFGGGETTTERGKAKYVGGGTVQNPDGSKEQGKKPESDSSSSSDDSTDSSSSDSSSDDSADDSSDDSDSGSDDNADSNDDSADSGDDSGSDDDSADDDSSSDEARNGFDSGGGSDGGPQAAAKTTVDDRVARMKGEKRDPESPEDSEPGNGGSAPGSVSQPGPDGGHRASPLARPSTEGHQSPVNVVVPTVKSRSSVGGGDCFRESGCDNAPTGDFRLDPFNRDPVTNPGGH